MTTREKINEFIRKYNQLLNICLMAASALVLSILIILQSTAAKNTSPFYLNAYGALIGVAGSVFASGLLGLIITPNFQTEKDQRYDNICEDWGLQKIHRTRSDTAILESNHNFPKRQLDIIAFGLTDFRNGIRKDTLKAAIINGLQIRILTLHPDSEYARKRKELEAKDIPANIRELYAWVTSLNEELQSVNANIIQIRFYNHLPLDFYCRSDNIIYVGPYLIKQESAQTITYEYSALKMGGEIYSNLFENIWSFRYPELKVNSSFFPIVSKSQSYIIEGVLKYFCEYLKPSVDSREDNVDNNAVIAVIALWTEKHQKRMTFYSCNKKPGIQHHNVKDYDMGVIGIMQKLSKQTKNGPVLYVFGGDEVLCYKYTRKKKLEVEKLPTDKIMSSDDIKTMIAIPLLQDNKCIGALTFDFISLPDCIAKYSPGDKPLQMLVQEEIQAKSENGMEKPIVKLFHDIERCANIITPLLADNIITNQEELMNELRKHENIN